MGKMVSFAGDGTTAEGYLAVPENPNGCGVIVIQEWWGLVGHVTALADRFAAEGYVALAPDLYHGVKTTEPDEAGKLMMGLAMDRVGPDIAHAASYLSTLPGISGRPGKIGTVGFCMGGSLALWAATLSEHITAAVGFYPAVPWERMNPQWSSYAGKAAVIHCSEQDGTSTAPGIQQAKQSIETAGGQVTLFDYPGTSHAFFNDERTEVFDAAAASLAWERTLDFLRGRLGPTR